VPDVHEKRTLGHEIEQQLRTLVELAQSDSADSTVRDTIVAEIDSLRELLARDGEVDVPADGGIAGLVGLGDETAPDFGQTRHAPDIRDYDETITSERLLAVSELYYNYQLERLGVYKCCLKLQQLFKAGTVRLSDGPGALALYRFDRKDVLRYSRKERWQAYRRVFGYTNVAPPKGGRPNREFHSQFTGFNTQVARFFRDQRISEVIRPDGRDAAFGSIAVVRRAGLDLRANLKQASYGHVNVMVVELSQLLEQAFRILGASDVQRLFGADSAWDVLEEVMRRYFRERIVASQRSRMAVAGRNVLRWLAYGHILEQNRPIFEGLLANVAESAEEWLTSAESVGSRPRKRGDNVIELRQRPGARESFAM